MPFLRSVNSIYLLHLHQSQQLFQVPDVIRQASFHRRGDAQRFVHAAEIEVHEIQRNHVAVILHFLTETIG